MQTLETLMRNCLYRGFFYIHNRSFYCLLYCKNYNNQRNLHRVGENDSSFIQQNLIIQYALEIYMYIVYEVIVIQYHSVNEVIVKQYLSY